MKQTTFIASPSFKLFAGRDQESIFFYREKSLLWEKKLPCPDATLAGLANNGLLLIRTKGGIYPHYASGEDPILPFERYSPRTLEMEGAAIGPLLVEELGNGFLIEKRSEKAKIAESLLGFLKRGKAESQGTNILYEIARYDIATEGEESIWKFEAEKGKGNFLWAATANLEYIVLSEQKGMQARMFLFEPRAGKRVYEVQLNDTIVSRLLINEDGVVLAKMESGDEVQYLGIRPSGDKFFINPVGADATVTHLGEKFLLFAEEDGRVLTFKNFEDKLLFTMDLKVLDEIQQEYHFFFKPNDDPVLVGRDPQVRTLNLVYTSLENLQIQYKSWLLEAEQKKHPPRPTDRDREEKEAANRREEMMAMKSQALSRALETEPRAPAQVPAPEIKSAPPLELEMELEAAKPETGKTPAQAAAGNAEIQEPAHPAEAAPAGQEPATASQPSSRALEFIPLEHEEGEAAEKPEPGPARHKINPEQARIESLLEKLEERFINGEISEKAYYELKKKYDRKLLNLKKS